MPAYVVAYGEITDPEVIGEYRRRPPSLFEKYGGTVVAGGKPELLEGDSNPEYVGIFQFPDFSPEYTRLAEFRKNAATVRLVLIEGR